MTEVKLLKVNDGFELKADLVVKTGWFSTRTITVTSSAKILAFHPETNSAEMKMDVDIR